MYVVCIGIVEKYGNPMYRDLVENHNDGGRKRCIRTHMHVYCNVADII